MVTGIILAGGPNRGMGGEHKSFLQFGEEFLIQRQIRIMREFCNEMIIVTNTTRPFLRKVDESVRIITDYIPHQGPLSGMHAGLTLAQNQYSWIVSCDMPFVSSKAAAFMLKDMNEALDVIFPVVKGKEYPLHGIYNRNCVKRIWSMLMGEDTKLHVLPNQLTHKEITDESFRAAGISTNFITSINTQEEYRAVLQIIEERKAIASKNIYYG